MDTLMAGMKLHFSVVVPTYRRPRELAWCLQALTRQDYPRDRFQVIVVDDGSGSPPREVIEEFENRLALTLICGSHGGPAVARNTGAARADGEFLAFTDDDCMPDRDWLTRLADAMRSAPGCMVGGRARNAWPRNSYAAASQIIVDYLYAYYNGNTHQAGFLASNNLAVPTRAFHDIGGFSPAFALAAGEDREICSRWRRHGRQIIYRPDIVVCHAHWLTLRGYFRQHFNYGCGSYRWYRERTRRGEQAAKWRPFGFYLDLMHYPYSRETGRRALRLTTLVGYAQGATGLGYLREGLRDVVTKRRNDPATKRRGGRMVK